MRRLITIGVSHYCEKGRWALQRAGLDFTEEATVPGLHIWHVKRAGGRRSTPVLVDGDRVLADSTDILNYLQDHPDAKWRPWPADAAARAEAEAWETRLDDELGPHARRLAYFYLMPDKPLLVGINAQRAPASHVRAFSAGYPLITELMRQTMRIDAAGVERSKRKIERIFDDIGERLADGRRYLVGDAFTAADLTFAALAAPTVLPDGYVRVALDAVHPELRALIEQCRAHPAGQFALAIYAEEHQAP